MTDTTTNTRCTDHNDLTVEGLAELIATVRQQMDAVDKALSGLGYIVSKALQDQLHASQQCFATLQEAIA